jgi:hypothetical protein
MRGANKRSRERAVQTKEKRRLSISKWRGSERTGREARDVANVSKDWTRRRGSVTMRKSGASQLEGGEEEKHNATNLEILHPLLVQLLLGHGLRERHVGEVLLLLLDLKHFFLHRVLHCEAEGEVGQR